METRGFENVKNQIGFCGIWCGSCTSGNGATQKLAEKFEALAKKSQNQLETWAPKSFNFNEFMKGLTAIHSMPLCPGCRKGGGDPNCKIRICALNKGLTDCSLCDQLLTCKNFEELERSHPKIKECLMGINENERAALIEKWVNELKTKWHHCILFCESTKK